MLRATDVGKQIRVAEHIHGGLVVKQDVAPGEEHDLVQGYESRLNGPIVLIDIFFCVCIEYLIFAFAIRAVARVVPGSATYETYHG